MNEKEFNLLDEPWILVMDDQCETKEVSLIELFGNTHLYKDLCGELPTQDFAVMRLLLAVLHTVFSRYDPDGTESPLNDPDDALDRWREIWEAGRFPAEVIMDYLESQRENFYLFHPERPFYQCKFVERVNKSYETTKLNGVMSKSDNADRLFTTVSKLECKSLEYSEAARWLINIISFDDSAVKAADFSKNGQKLNSPGVGWLGKLGLIAAHGNNLFQTLMLNFILLNENGNLYNKEKPIWESKKAIERERIKIIPPDNLSELYTLPSRLVLLQKESEKVCEYKILSGVYFDDKNSFIEPMTLWRNINSNVVDQYKPQTHDSAKQFWRDFSSVFSNYDKTRQPGIISWLKILDDSDCIKKIYLRLKIASIEYDAKKCKVVNIFSDSLQLHSSLLSKMNAKWQKTVVNSVEFCDNIANKVEELAKKINLATCGSDKIKNNNGSSAVFAERAKAEFYDRLDLPFREWLCALNPETDSAVDREKEWRGQCLEIARKLGNELIGAVRTEAIFGRRIKKEGEKSEIRSAANAVNWFYYQLTKAQNH